MYTVVRNKIYNNWMIVNTLTGIAHSFYRNMMEARDIARKLNTGKVWQGDKHLFVK